jgi:PAS domain S-box-containing protein
MVTEPQDNPGGPPAAWDPGRRDRPVEHPRDVIMELDAAGVVRYVSAGWDGISGRPPAEALGRPLADLLRPGDRVAAAPAVAAWFRGEEHDGFTCRVPRRDGPPALVAVRGLPRHPDRRTVLVIAMDVTATHRAALLQSLHLEVTGALAIAADLTDAMGGVLPALARALELTYAMYCQISPAGDRLDGAIAWQHAGRPPLVPGRLSARRDDPGPLVQAWTTGEVVWVPDLRDRAAAGADPLLTHAVAAGVALRGVVLVPLLADGEVVGVIACGGERTFPVDRELMATFHLMGGQIGQFVSRRIAGERAERMKQELFALVSHELRTPLTSIIAYLEALRESAELSEQGLRFLTVLDRNAARLRRLIEDMLVAADAGGRPFQIHRRNVDVSELVRASVAHLTTQAGVAGVEVRLDLPDQPLRCGVDPQRLAQAVENLVSNGLKFTCRGGSVTVTATRYDDGVEVSVADTGRGIAERDLPMVFGRFWRAEDVMKDAVPGAGLGLTVVKAIAEGHGGTVRLHSGLGVGTRAVLYVPDGPAEPAPDTGTPLEPELRG